MRLLSRVRRVCAADVSSSSHSDCQQRPPSSALPGSIRTVSQLTIKLARSHASGARRLGDTRSVGAQGWGGASQRYVLLSLRTHVCFTSRISQGQPAWITWTFDTLQILNQTAETGYIFSFARLLWNRCHYHRKHRPCNMIGYGTRLLYLGECSYCHRLLIVGSPPSCGDPQNRSIAFGNRTERPSVALPVSVAPIRLTSDNRNQPPSDLANGFDSRYGSLREVGMLIHGCGAGATLRYVQVSQAELYVLIMVFFCIYQCSRA